MRACWDAISSNSIHAFRRDYQTRIELVQDLRFETASTKIKASPNGECLIASGIYPPQVKVYELRELALKFERHLVSEIVDFEVLDEDSSKIAFLCADRSVNLHAKYGSHYSLRIPRMGRDLAYDCWSCDLLCAASSPQLYRINLDQGRFLSPLKTQSPALNVVSRSKLHGLVGCGGEDGYVECFDMRARSGLGRINVTPAGDIGQEVTAVQFEDDAGFLMAVGSSVGKILIYDMRSSHPLFVKDHMYGTSIVDIKWHRSLNSQRANLITTDKHIVRVWDPETGEGMTSIEPSGGKINDTCIFSESGLMLLALDGGQIPSYFIPALGPAPKWCSYLENLTEELEEGAQTTIYDDFKFLTKEELGRLNLTNLIGTNLLRAYMHGYFIDYRLYKKAQSVAVPFKYDEYIEQRKKEKLEAERGGRITLKRKLPKVNRLIAKRIFEDEAEFEKDGKVADTKNTSRKRKGLSSEILTDERFKDMFENKNFEVDEKSGEYLALHPMPSSNKQPSSIEEYFEPISDVGDQDISDSDASDGLEAELAKKGSCVPRMYEVKDARHVESFSNSKSLANEENLSMGERVAALQEKKIHESCRLNGIKFGTGGSREISFVSRNNAIYVEDEFDMDVQRPKKRGVRSLGLKPHKSFQGRGRCRRG